MLNTCVHHKAKAIYDNWYADIRMLYNISCSSVYARRQVISNTAYVFMYETRGELNHCDRYIFQIYGRINIHIVKY